MKKIYEEKIITELDETICKLESMGTILELVCTTECGVYPDLSRLADLGRVIQSLAMEALEVVGEMELEARRSSGREEMNSMMSVR